MPLFEYIHKGDVECEEACELLLKMSDDVPETIECEVCGEEMKRVLFSKNNFHLKGAGWFKDHYGLKQGKR